VFNKKSEKLLNYLNIKEKDVPVVNSSKDIYGQQNRGKS